MYVDVWVYYIAFCARALLMSNNLQMFAKILQGYDQLLMNPVVYIPIHYVYLSCSAVLYNIVYDKKLGVC